MDETDVLVNDLIAAASSPDSRERVRHIYESSILELSIRFNGIIDTLVAQNKRLTKRLEIRGG